MHPQVLVLPLTLASCGAPDWPEDHFPPQLEVERTLFAEGSNGIREACEAIVVEITDRSAMLLQSQRRQDGRWLTEPPNGWLASPMPTTTDAQSYYKSAFSGCNDEHRRPLGDLAGAVQRPGAYYRVINNGEGIAIILPRAKLAGFFYFG